MRKRKATRYSWLQNFTLVVISLIVSCLAAEFVLRLTMSESIALFPRFHSAAVYGDYTLRRTQPNSHFTHRSADGHWDFKINAQGFRDARDYNYEKPKATLRVLALGDSNTLGYEVRQQATFSEIIERDLAARGIKAEVLNTGVSGFSTAEQLAFLENEGLRYRPDIVLLAFYRNDFEDNMKAGLFRLDDDELVAVKKRHTPGVRILEIINSLPGVPWLSQNSYLYSLVMNSMWGIAKQALLDKAMAELGTEYAVGTKELTAQMKRLSIRLIERMYRLAKSRNIQFIIMEIPASTAGRGKWVPSIPDEMRDQFRANSDRLITAESVFAPFRGRTDFHARHGHKHINEFSHLLLGRSAAGEILALQSVAASKTADSRRSP